MHLTYLREGEKTLVIEMGEKMLRTEEPETPFDLKKVVFR